MAVVLDNMHMLRETLARSPPGICAGGSLQIPSLKPVGHQSTNWIVRFVLMIATAALTSLGTTSPRYNKAQATGKHNSKCQDANQCFYDILYLPSLGSHFTIW